MNERRSTASTGRASEWLAFGDEAAQKLINKAMREAQESVEGVAQDPGLVEQARRRAERVLRGAFEVMGWEVKLVWNEKSDQDFAGFCIE